MPVVTLLRSFKFDNKEFNCSGTGSTERIVGSADDSSSNTVGRGTGSPEAKKEQCLNKQHR